MSPLESSYTLSLEAMVVSKYRFCRRGLSHSWLSCSCKKCIDERANCTSCYWDRKTRRLREAVRLLSVGIYLLWLLVACVKECALIVWDCLPTRRAAAAVAAVPGKVADTNDPPQVTVRARSGPITTPPTVTKRVVQSKTDDPVVRCRQWVEEVDEVDNNKTSLNQTRG